jgi:hypothetical protein
VPNPIAIVGAGLAGLVAATELQRAGHPVVVVDKGRSVGGRLATRRLGTGAIADHGAQFFTVRSERFAAFVDPLVDSGTVREWCRGFNEVDGHPRYAVTGGMNGLAKHLAGGLADGAVRCGVQLEAISPAPGGGWTLRWAGGALEAAAVIATPPVPQTLALTDTGGTELDGGLREALAGVAYHRVLAVMAVLDRPSAVPAPGARQLDSGVFSFVADNQAKGISAHPVVTLHANHGQSASWWDRSDDANLADLLDAAAPWLGGATVVEAHLKKWRYSGPRTPWPEAACVAKEGSGPLVLAGDAFAGPKVEGAFLSGLAAAAAVTART